MRRGRQWECYFFILYGGPGVWGWGVDRYQGHPILLLGCRGCQRLGGCQVVGADVEGPTPTDAIQSSFC